ncbi:hypothetical protein Tco_0032278 [Tanacetum coccineum]
MLTECGDDVTSIKRRRRGLPSDDVRELTTASGPDRNLRALSGEEAWEAIENFAQGQKEWDNPPNIIFEQELANLKAQAKRLFGDENVWVEMHREEVEETLGTPIEVEPLDETQLEDLGLNTCNHDLPLSSREVPSFDKPEPQPQSLPNCPPLDASLGNERGLKQTTKPPNHIVFNTWMAFGGNIRDLGLFGEETDEITDLHQILEEILLIERRDGVACIKRRHRDPSSDDVRRFSDGVRDVADSMRI